ncbi:MAG: hypothetical protein ACM3S1_15625 [Hyphomicrobiales bacterium]
MTVARVGALLAVLANVLFAACGGGSHLPEPPPCTTPTPIPSQVPPDTRQSDVRYARAVRDAIDELGDLTDDFRGEWPDRRYSSQPEFRTDFVNYYGESTCLVQALGRLSPPATGTLTDEAGELQLLLQQYESVLDQGLEAVQKRNVSDYRQFHRDLDSAYDQLVVKFGRLQP